MRNEQKAKETGRIFYFKNKSKEILLFLIKNAFQVFLISLFERITE
jgi:hypothetical protein